MRMLAKVTVAVTCLMLGTSCAADSEPGSIGGYDRYRQCFNARSVNSFRPAGRDAVDVVLSRNQVYRLSLGGGCFDVDWAQAVALRSRTGDAFICSALDAELIVPTVGGRNDRCLVTDIRRLTRAEIDASRRN